MLGSIMNSLMLKGYTAGLMPGSNTNAGLDAGPVQLGAVPVRCRALDFEEILTPLLANGYGLKRK